MRQKVITIIRSFGEVLLCKPTKRPFYFEDKLRSVDVNGVVIRQTKKSNGEVTRVVIDKLKIVSWACFADQKMRIWCACFSDPKDAHVLQTKRCACFSDPPVCKTWACFTDQEVYTSWTDSIYSWRQYKIVKTSCTCSVILYLMSKDFLDIQYKVLHSIMCTFVLLYSYYHSSIHGCIIKNTHFTCKCQRFLLLNYFL